ncbi:MAG TPA: ABC transporter permease [Candidatus Dormibacteraeota bacterium]|nr:ABC transporter permease [Candidatus Dormibacteraeota bacterium]
MARLRSVVPVLAGAAILLVAWQLIVLIGGYPEFILPGPAVVLTRFVRAWIEGPLPEHTWTTLVEIVLGFAAGAALGLGAGALLARSKRASLVLSPYFVAAQSTPILALAPLLVLWFGDGLLGKIVICALIVFFPVAVSTMVGLRTVDRRLIELGRSLRASRRRILASIELPAALPQILGGMRVGVTLAVVGAVIAEWAGAKGGLGWLINLTRGSSFDTPLLFATLLTIALLGVGLYGLMTLVERRLVGARG